MTQRQIIVPRPSETGSAGGLQLWGLHSSVGNKILEFPPQDELQTDQVVYLARSAQVDMLQQAFQALSENRSLRQKVQALEAQMVEMRSQLGLDQPGPREITRAKAKREVASYFEAHSDETIYPSDVAEELNLDYDAVMDAIKQLERAGTVAKQD